MKTQIYSSPPCSGRLLTPQFYSSTQNAKFHPNAQITHWLQSIFISGNQDYVYLIQYLRHPIANLTPMFDYSPSTLRTRLRHTLCSQSYGRNVLCKHITFPHKSINTGRMLKMQSSSSLMMTLTVHVITWRWRTLVPIVDGVYLGIEYVVINTWDFIFEGNHFYLITALVLPL
jgi:hypothetical protein